MPHESCSNIIQVCLLGLMSQDAEDLCTALGCVTPGRFRFDCVPGTFESIDAARLDGRALLVGSGALPEGQGALEAVRMLRTERCCWSPVHLLLRNPPRLAEDATREWAVWSDRLPLRNVREFAETLARPRRLSEARQLEIVRAILASAADDLAVLRRSLDPSRAVDPARVRATLGEVEAELAPHAADFPDLSVELTRLRSLAEFTDQDLDQALPGVLAAEKQAQDAGLERLASRLHGLCNVLRLARWRPEAATDIARRLFPRLTALRERGAAVLPESQRGELVETLGTLVPVVEKLSSGPFPEGAACQIEEAIPVLRSTTRSLEPRRSADACGVLLRRVVVVEDDPDWRRVVSQLLADMDLGVPVREAGSVQEAAGLLRQPEPALALVDLGLPHVDGGEVDLEAGLSLIKQFTGTDAQGNLCPHRYVVLTGAENRSDAVRAALLLGVDPRSYVQKHPATWESQLRIQVRLAMQPPPDRLPAVEVFMLTKRVARVEGLETTLPYPVWCLLAAFAEGPRGWRQPRALARVMAGEPYWLDPNSEDEDEAEDKIERQLPHYTSALRIALTKAYRRARHGPPPLDFIEFDPLKGYHLNASVRALKGVEEYYRNAVSARRPSVLVVEDDPDWGNSICNELHRRGFEPRLARWADQARQMAAAEPPDLVSLDLELPRTEEALRNGGEAHADHALSLLRSLLREHPGVPVAVLTSVAWRDREMLEIVSRGGVRIDDYLSKHDPDPLARLAGSLERLWREWLNGTRILDWDRLAPVHPIRIDPDVPILTHVAGYPVTVRGNVETLLRVLSASPNVFVSRTELIEAIWPDPDGSPEGDPFDALKALNRRLRRAIDDATRPAEEQPPAVKGEEVICGDRGVIWLRGIVQ